MIADQFENFFFDLDGVIYIGPTILPPAFATLPRLRSMGKTIRFLTNGPCRTRKEIADRLNAAGIEVAAEEFVTASWATAVYLREQGIQTVYVVGLRGAKEELTEAGITIRDHDVDAVVVGCAFDVLHDELTRAMRLILDGARFIATNADAVYPAADGLAPGGGAVVAALQSTSGKQPTVIGKPYPAMFHAALKDLAHPESTVMIGDTPNADILGAHQQGLAAVLIAPSAPQYPLLNDFRIPDAVIPDVSGLFDPQIILRRWDLPTFSWPEQIAPSVAAVVFDATGRVLLGKRADTGVWGLPSGHVVAGETVAEAIVREVLALSGLRVEVNHLVGVYSSPASQVFVYPTGKSVQYITTCFQCSMTAGDVQADGTEILEVAFFEPDQLPDELLPMHPQWLADALEGSNRAFIR
jgi:HAD superfamily hydrolase (TIGR01450 family)